MSESPRHEHDTKGGDVISLDDPNYLLKVSEVAALARLSTAAVYRAVRAGELHAIRLRGRVRVRVEDFQHWLDESEVPPPDDARTPARRRALPDVRGLRILLGDQRSDP